MQDNPIKPSTEITEADWRRYSEEWEASGESQSAFCRRNQISYSAFGYWRMKFNKQKEPAKVGGFANVQLSPKQTLESNMLRLTLPNGINVLVPGNVNKQLLKEILGLLGVA